MTKAQSDIGLIGLAVMGQNLALNIADASRELKDGPGLGARAISDAIEAVIEE